MSTINELGSVAEKSDARLSASDIKIMGLTSLGGALEFYEFVIFILLTPYISQVFFPPTIPEWVRVLETLFIFSTGYLIRPVGGIILGVFGDLFGRKRVFSLTMVLMAIPTLLIGLLPSYETLGFFSLALLLLCRLLQGIALGGEVPAATVFVAEHVGFRHLGFACALMGVSRSAGLLIGSLAIGFLDAHFSKPEMLSYGWRIAFIVGGLFGFFATYLRRYVHESPVFQSLRERKGASDASPLRSLFRSSTKPIIYCCLVASITAAIVPAIYLYPPIYFRTALKFNPGLVQTANTFAIAAMIIGSLIGGWMMDKFGGMKVLIAFSAGAVISAFCLFISVRSGSDNLVLLYTVTGFLGSFAAFAFYFLVQSFPMENRLTGVSLSYNVSSALLGGLTPVILDGAIRLTPLAPAYFTLLIAAIGIVGAILLVPFRRPLP